MSIQQQQPPAYSLIASPRFRVISQMYKRWRIAKRYIVADIALRRAGNYMTEEFMEMHDELWATADAMMNSNPTKPDRMWMLDWARDCDRMWNEANKSFEEVE
jgi:deoxyadenosine/deoxycytidine kinase